MGIGRKAMALGAGLLVAVSLAACSSSSTSTTTTMANSGSATATTLSSAQVSAIQGRLLSVGCYNGKVDGISGPLTTTGIRKFQKAEGLNPDGIYGPATNVALVKAAHNGTTVCMMTPSTTTTSAVTPTTSAPAAPCTSSALQAALNSATKTISSATTPPPFGCSGIYAYAFVDVTAPQPDANYTYTQVFQATGGEWTLADRSSVCPMIPAAIYHDACQTN